MNLATPLLTALCTGSLVAQAPRAILTVPPPTYVCHFSQAPSTTHPFPYFAASAAGDVDGDARADVVGHIYPFGWCPPWDIWSYPETRYLLFDSGRVISGATGAQIWPTATSSGVVAAVGDTNGDGYDDVLSGPILQSGRNGVILRTHPTVYPIAVTSVAGVGDTDGDGFDDYAIATANGAGDRGTTKVYSGRTGAELWLFAGRQVGAARDSDGDGFADVLIGDPFDPAATAGSVTLRSGADGTTLRQWFGTAGESFGTSVDRAGDVDADRVDEILVGATAPDGGRAYVYDGATGALIRTLTRPAPRRYGAHVRTAGDVDGDGFADQLVEHRAEFSYDITTDVYSGATGGLLARLPGQSGGGAGDFDGDGFDDVVTANPALYVWSLATTGTPGRVTQHGLGCPGAGVRIPRIGWRGTPAWGRTLDVTLHGAAAAAPVALHIGDPIGVSLEAIGMPGCSLYSAPFLAVPRTTNADGIESLDIAWSASAAPIGARFELQWAILDPGANALGVALSDAATVVVGQ